MSERGMDYLSGVTKRRLDVVGATALAGIFALPTALAAAGSAIDTRDNPLYTQDRVGLGKQEFSVLKLRTLRRVLVGDDAVGRDTIDERASWYGNLLRGSGMDETPQFINVIKGDMSLVGLRAVRTMDFDRYRDADPGLFEDWLEGYVACRPAISGLSQLYRKGQSSPTPETWIESMKLDLEYIETATLIMDLRILAQTPFRLLSTQLIGATPSPVETGSSEPQT